MWSFYRIQPPDNVIVTRIDTLKECGLPDIGWHGLRTSFYTLLWKNEFSPKAVFKLMGHAKELITVDVYGDNNRENF